MCLCLCSTLALQRACEEGCVEPEAATGGDCSDDTLLAGNGNTQQYVHTQMLSIIYSGYMDNDIGLHSDGWL